MSHHMEEIDKLIQRYAPIDLATGDHAKDAMTIDLRNIRHHAFGLLCDLKNLERRHETLANEMRQLMEFKDMASRVTDIYKYFIRDFKQSNDESSTK